MESKLRTVFIRGRYEQNSHRRADLGSSSPKDRPLCVALEYLISDNDAPRANAQLPNWEANSIRNRNWRYMCRLQAFRKKRKKRNRRRRAGTKSNAKHQHARDRTKTSPRYNGRGFTLETPGADEHGLCPQRRDVAPLLPIAPGFFRGRLPRLISISIQPRALSIGIGVRILLRMEHATKRPRPNDRESAFLTA